MTNALDINDLYQQGFEPFQGGMNGGGIQQDRQYNMQSPSPHAPVNQGGPGNPHGAYNMAKPLPRFQNNKGPAPLSQQDYRDRGINPGNMYGMINQSQQMPQLPMPDQWNRGDLRSQLRDRLGFRGDPFNRYGYAGQSPQLGRYQPPMMTNPNDVNAWNNQGGYAYNIPNSYGSGQWNQFNAMDRPFPMFGQSQNTPQQAGPPMNVRYRSPFESADPSRSQNYYSYLSSLSQPQQPTYTQPGTPDQTGPVT